MFPVHGAAPLFFDTTEAMWRPIGENMPGVASAHVVGRTDASTTFRWTCPL